jgi:photosystem II stability/assembly factor-like uncharacterized protein
MPRALLGIAMVAVCNIATAQNGNVVVRTVGLPGIHINDVAVAPTDPVIAYAATPLGLFKTANRGQSWKKVREGPVDLIALDATDTKTAYASSTYNFETVKTTNGGATWSQVRPDIASVLAVAPSNPAAVYAALYNAGMSKSDDAGTTWSTIMSGLPHDFFYVIFESGWDARSIAVDPTNASTVYVGKPQGLFKTTDGGMNWQLTATIPSAPSLVVDGGDPSVIYAASNVSGVLKSSDGGIVWNDAGLTDKRVLAMTISRTSPAALFAGTADGFVYRSTNGGADWSLVEDASTGTPILRMSVDASGTSLYVATADGVYQYQFFNDNISIEGLAEDPLRLPRLFDQLSNKAGLVLPVVGTVNGSGGFFTTEVTLSNKRERPQDVVLTWLPQAAGANEASFRMTLPASSSQNGGTVSFADIAGRLGISGIGSLAVFAVGVRDDNLDPSASIDGSARIWVYPADGSAPSSQMISAADSTLLSNHTRGVVAGLQQDAGFRTNAGIVNLSADVHQFTIQIHGERGSGQLTIAVPPFSLVQVPITATDYGHLDLVVFADRSSRWVFYGSTINNSTLEAHTILGAPSDNQ